MPDTQLHVTQEQKIREVDVYSTVLSIESNAMRRSDGSDKQLLESFKRLKEYVPKRILVLLKQELNQP